MLADLQQTSAQVTVAKGSLLLDIRPECLDNFEGRASEETQKLFHEELCDKIASKSACLQRLFNGCLQTLGLQSDGKCALLAQADSTVPASRTKITPHIGMPQLLQNACIAQFLDCHMTTLMGLPCTIPEQSISTPLPDLGSQQKSQALKLHERLATAIALSIGSEFECLRH